MSNIGTIYVPRLLSESYYTPELMEKFWSHVEKKGKDECWIWAGSRSGSKKTNNEAAQFGPFHGIKVLAARFAYELFYGPFDLSLSVLHTCDNRMCVNYFHLFLGTQKVNMQDMSKKGRHKSQKLLPNQLNEIVDLLKAGTSNKEIEAQFGITSTYISKLKRQNGIRTNRVKLCPI